MLLFPTAEFRKRRGRTRPAPSAVALTLVAAVFDEAPPRVRLTFDRAVDVAGLAGGEIRVDDGLLTGLSYHAAAASVSAGDPRTAQVELVEAGTWGIDEARLNAGPGTGIVAADDGGTWAGVENLLLPFPS